MKIDCVVLGDFQTNAYVVRGSDRIRQCLLIDPGMEPEPLVDFVESESLEPTAVVLTHGHVDHIAGVVEVKKAFPKLKVYVHRLDAQMLTDPRTNLSAYFSEPCRVGRADVLVDHGQIIEEAGLRLQVIHTPGHSPGGICLYDSREDAVFTDDCLFAGSVGRTDFPGSSQAQLIRSIHAHLLTLPDATIVYPGHGPSTTIAREKRENPFLQAGHGLHMDQ